MRAGVVGKFATERVTGAGKLLQDMTELEISGLSPDAQHDADCFSRIR